MMVWGNGLHSNHKYSQYSYHTPQVDIDAGLVVVVTSTGRVARYVAKYRPNVPVLVITDSPQVKRHTNMMYAAYPYHVPQLPQEKVL